MLSGIQIAAADETMIRPIVTMTSRLRECAYWSLVAASVSATLPVTLSFSLVRMPRSCVRHHLAFAHRNDAGLGVGFRRVLPGEIGDTILQRRPLAIEFAELCHAGLDLRIVGGGKAVLERLDELALLRDLVDDSR